MHTEKYSFIKSILGTNTYEVFKGYAKKYIPMASIVLAIVFVLTCFFHWSFLSSILNMITGTSLIFIVYILGMVFLLDYEVDVELEETRNGSYRMSEAKPNGYINTKVCGILLVILAIGAIYFSNKYRNHYAFECETFLVDENKGIYHLDGYNDYCDEKKDCYNLVPMKGYEIEDEEYECCMSCKEWAEDAEEIYESERYTYP